jgi:hypothetical protein
MPPCRMVPALEVPGTVARDLSHPRGSEACVYSPETDHIQDERHSYEKCQYEEFKLRVKKMDELKAQNPGHRSN